MARTQVCIIGGGPAGLLLSQILHRADIDTIVLERKSRAYVLSRIRAGLLESGSADLFRKAGVGERMDAEGIVHDGALLAAENRTIRIDFKAATGKTLTIYGQTEITADLYAARDAMGGVVHHDVDAVEIHDADTSAPFVTYRDASGAAQRINCDFVAGCDGFHGVSRKTIPSTILREYEKVYPFGWLGVLSDTPPVSHELIYANHERGFALCTMRSNIRSRYYIQTPADDVIENWSDNAFWDELRKRIPEEAADNLVTGPSIEKSIAPLRSFVAEPMRWGNLFLVGDAAHIVPPTGAKGLNLAASDVHYLSEGLIAHYANGDSTGLNGYSDLALARVWKAIRFSWWMTSLLHRFPDQTEFEQKLQESEIGYLESSLAARTMMAEQYVGVPY